MDEWVSLLSDLNNKVGSRMAAHERTNLPS